MKTANRGLNWVRAITLLLGISTLPFALEMQAADCISAPTGLVGWWSGDHHSRDLSGNYNFGEMTDVSFAAGKVGPALEFSSNTAVFRATASDSLAAKSLTFAAWINPSDSTYRPIMMYQKDQDYMGAVFWTGRRTGETNRGALYANFREAPGREAIIEIADVVPANAWTFVAATYDQASGLARIYVNGEVVKEATLPSYSPNTAGNLCIGYAPHTTLDANGGIRFNGLIDEPMIFNRALASAEVSAMYNADSAGICGRSALSLALALNDPLLFTTNGLVAAYGLNGDAVDSTGHNLDGTVYGDSFTTDRFGRTNSALRVTGTNTYVDLGNQPEFNFTNGFTLNAWIKAEEGPGGYVIGKYGADYTVSDLENYSYGMGTHDFRGPYGFVFGEGTVYQDIVAGPVLTDDKWHLLTLTFRDGDGIRLYTDGQFGGSKATGDLAPLTNDLPLLIGKITTGLPFIGAIDDVSIYNRPLSESEIRLLHTYQGNYHSEQPVALQQATATFSEEGFPVNRAADGVIDPSGAWGISPAITNQVAVFETETNVGAEGGTVFAFKLVFANPSSEGTTSHTLGRFRLLVTTDARDTFADGLQVDGDVTANWLPLEVLSASAISGATLTVLPDSSILASGNLARLDTYTVKTATRLTGITGVRLEVLEDPSLPHDGPGREPLNGNFALSELLMATRPGGAPLITNSPSSLIVTNGNSAVFTVGALSSLPTTYQWKLNGSAIVGATNSSLEITNASYADAGTYTVEVATSEGWTLSSGAVLNVVPENTDSFAAISVSNSTPTNAPVTDIFGSPASGTAFLARVYAGPAPESLTAQGPAVPFLDGDNAGYFTPFTLIMTNVLHGSNAFVQVRVWEISAGGSFEQAVASGGQHGVSAVIETATGGGPVPVPQLAGLAPIALVAAPRILQQPENRTVLVGESASFSVEAWGSTLSYQWFVNSNAVAGANSANLTLTNLQAENSGPIYVVVSNNLGSVTSAVQNLIVEVPPTVTITSPAAIETFDTHVTLSGSVTDDYGIAAVSWSRNGDFGGAIELADGQFSITNIALVRGPNTFRVTATDTSGNSNFSEVTITNVPSRSVFVAEIPPHQEGARVEVPIMLASRGDVGGVTFTLSYNRDFLAEPEIRWESAVDGALTSFNTNLFNAVRGSFALSGTSVATGEVRVATITFRTRSVSSPRTVPLGLSLNGLFAPDGGTLSAVGTEVRSGLVQITVRKIKGDNNANDRLDIGDAATIMRLDSGIEQVRPWDTAKNDLNTNFQIDVGDVIRVLRTVVGLDPQPTIPGAQPVRAFSAGSARMTLQIEGTNTAPGGQVKVLVNIADYTQALAAASFKLRYPTNALRLTSATSHQLGSLVPTGAATIWNVSPAQNDYEAQDGSVSLAVTSDRPWQTNVGELAELTFTVQPGATNQHRWAITLQQGELSNGLDLYPAAGSETFFIARGAVAPQFDATPEITDEGISLSFTAEAGLSYRIEASEDLVNWTPITTVTSEGSTVSYTDPIAENASKRFYRTVQID